MLVLMGLKGDYALVLWFTNVIVLYILLFQQSSENDLYFEFVLWQSDMNRTLTACFLKPQRSEQCIVFALESSAELR